jgi:hypothetical protein
MKLTRNSPVGLHACWRMLIVLMSLSAAHAGAAETGPRLHTNQAYIEELQAEPMPTHEPRALFAQVLARLGDRVTVYPTEGYYYFRFLQGGVQYAGNIRLDAENRDQGKVHFAYYKEPDARMDEDSAIVVAFDSSHGVIVEKLGRFSYRVSDGATSVTFELADLSHVQPRPGMLQPEEQYIGPVFDESGVRFLLVYNPRLRIFHYLLDESVRPTDELEPLPATDRILVGRRTGFAFYRDHKRDRRILIGVLARNAQDNNYFDGPFDQLPDGYIEGEALRNAILATEPHLAGKIDRFGSFLPDRSNRHMIAPYRHYRTLDDLLVFHRCATSKRRPAERYHACFVFDERRG